MKRIFHTDIQQKGPDGKPSQEWKDIRRAKFTSTDAAAYMVTGYRFRWTKKQICEKLDELATPYKKSFLLDELTQLLPVGFAEKHKSLSKEASDAIDSIIDGKLAEMMGCETPEPNMPWWVKRGNELEPEARDAFHRETGLEIEEMGFVSIEGHYIGDSPDGLLNDRKDCLEIKIPLDKTHVGYLRRNVLPDEHRFQVAHHLAVTGCERCHFYSWSPNPLIPSFYKIVRRDDFADQLLNGLVEMSDALKLAKSDYMEIYNEYVERLRAAS